MGEVSRQLLLERESELARLGHALEATRAGQGQLVIVEAGAGLGKTRLLDVAIDRARELDMTSLRAQGSELEGDFAFGVVRQLLEPVLDRVAGKERERIFAGAAALAAPLFDSPPQAVTDSPADAMFTTLHGLYWLVSNLTDGGPLALAVDDAHWADTPSLRFLAFLHARLVELPVTLIVALRSGDPGAERAPLMQLTAAPEANVVQPRPLSTEAVGELLRAALDRDPDPAVVTACHDVTAGNPFYLRALLAELASRRPRDDAGLAKQVRRAGPRAVSRSVLSRVAAIAPAAPALARAVAVLGDGAAIAEAAVLAQLEESDAAGVADRLTQAAILKPGRGLGFVHPIVAAAIYSDLAPHERAAHHARAAAVLEAAGASPERIAAQLMHSEPVGDAGAVDVLARAAADAIGRGAPETAITFLQRALEEPAPEASRSALLLRLGTAEFQDGRMSAAEHLQAVLGTDVAPALRVQAALLLARALAYGGRPHDAIATLQHALDTVAASDRERALELEAELIATAQLDVLPGEIVADRFRRLRLDDVSQARTFGECKLLAVHAFQALRDNRPAATVIELGRKALAGPAGHRLPYSLPVSLGEWALAYAGGHDFLDAWLEQELAGARARGAVSEFAAVSSTLAVVARARGDLFEAESHVQVATRVLDAPAAAVMFAGLQGGLLLERGEVAAAERVLAQAGVIGVPADQVPLSEALYARGHLRAAQGDHAGGLRDLLACGERLVSTGSQSPAAFPWRSSAALEQLALGDRLEARRLAADELALARAFGAARPLGIALRAAGLVEGGERGIGLLREAVRVLEPSPARLALALALVDLGASIRRGGQRSAARAPLARGRELAHACGADALVLRAEAELEAAGVRPRPQVRTGLDALTPSERRIARMAADGLSNPQIAQALFVSTKTIETHLGHAYQKLGISSRQQLPRFSEPEPIRKT